MTTQPSKAVMAAKTLAEQLTGQHPNIESGACLISLPDIGSTSGRITLREAEMLVDGNKVQSKAVRNGDLEVFPSKELQVFNTIRVAAKRLLSTIAVEVGGLFLCPINKLDTVIVGLEELKYQFETEVAALGNRYDKILAEHKAKNTAISHLIDRHKLVWDEFKLPFRFRLNPVLAVCPLLGDADELAQSAAQSLWEEIAHEAKQQHRTSFASSEKVTQKAIRAVGRLRDKLVNLSFLHSGIDAIVEEFDQLFNTIPKTGPVEGINLLRVAIFLMSISDAENLRLMAEGKYVLEQLDIVDDELIFEDDLPFETDDVMSAFNIACALDEGQLSYESIHDAFMRQMPAQVDVTTDGWGSF